MRVDLFEEEGYWEADVYPSIGKSINYGEYKTAGDCVNHLLSVYPGVELELDVTSLEAYNNIHQEYDCYCKNCMAIPERNA